LTGPGAAPVERTGRPRLGELITSRPAHIGYADGFKLPMVLTLIACPLLLIPPVALAPPHQ
jgi:hypothetical protein